MIKISSRSIVGYADRLSVAPQERIGFKVSAEGHSQYRCDIVRIISADHSPHGAGFREEVIETSASGIYPGRTQPISTGSYAVVPDSSHFGALRSFSVAAMIWPTLAGKGTQVIAERKGHGGGFSLRLDANGALSIELTDAGGSVSRLSTGKPLTTREWYFVGASYNAADHIARLVQEPLVRYARDESRAVVEALLETGSASCQAPLVFAASLGDGRPCHHFNGKIDSPRIYAAALSDASLRQAILEPFAQDYGTSVIGAWDFNRDISSVHIRDISPNRIDGSLVNLPTRAMKGWNWDGTELNWRHAAHQYGAIHFHDTDFYDAGWSEDFALVIPVGLRSGVYAARLTAGDEVERIPFFVLPERGMATSDILFLAPTASYMAYANEHLGYDSDLAEIASGHLPALGREDIFLAARRDFGYSLYETHTDGSGVSVSSRLRPILNMRPGHTTSWVGPAGVGPWQFSADLHITAWLEDMGHRFDVATDEDLHSEGLALLSRYRVVITGTHPEYYSTAMSDAVKAYLERGGRLMYLGANGFYWRIAFHPDLPGVIELRRVEDGVRDWASEAGEYYMSFTGEYGGLWRRNGRSPQSLVGIGFIAQGFDVSTYYCRMPGSFDPRAAFTFEGVGKEEKIGDFGLIGGGAAGLELDIVDYAVGSPQHTLVLAASQGHGQAYGIVPEEIFSPMPNTDGTQNERVRAELAFVEMPNGGGVFGTGSIAWAASLPCNHYNNNVSRITHNVLKRFLDSTPL